MKSLSLSQSHPIAGILCIILATLSFATADALAKQVGEYMPVSQIIWVRNLISLMFLAPIWWKRGIRNVFKAHQPFWQIIRASAILGSSFTFIFSLKYLNVADATAISFIAPAFIVLLAILFLNEKATRWIWFGIVLGLSGTLFIMPPAMQSGGIALSIPLVSAFCWAVSVIVTRHIGLTDELLSTMSWTVLIGFVFTSILLPTEVYLGSVEVWLQAAIVGICASIGQIMMIYGYKQDSASKLAPFSYIQILWSTIYGFLLFDIVPGWTFLIGVIFIISGSFCCLRQTTKA